MTFVRQILQAKGQDTWTIDPDATVLQALEVMAAHNIGALVVTEEDEVVGIFSERDYARRVVLHGKASSSTLISEVMTPEVICVNPEQTVDKCMAVMSDKHIRHLPVLENDRLVGVISIGDVVKTIISDQQVMINHLEDYIYG